MGIEVARRVAGRGPGAGRPLVLASALLIAGLGAALAQDKVQEPLAAPALSSACEVPAGDIAAPVPLPRAARALGERKRLRVLAIGSSSTVGVGASARRLSYPAQLQDILERTIKGLDVEMTNLGVSGEVAAATAGRLKAQVEASEPDLVLWQVGTNDALSRVPVETFGGTVRDTVRWLKGRGVDLVLVGLQYTPRLSRDAHYVATKEALRTLAAEEGVLLVSRYEAMRFIAVAGARARLLDGDELHLNDLGYRCMAEHVARALVLNAFARGAKDVRR